MSLLRKTDGTDRLSADHRRALQRVEILMWISAAAAFLLALHFAPGDEHCDMGDVVSSQAFVAFGWAFGLACVGASTVNLIRRRGVWVKIGSTAAYLVFTLILVVVIALQDNPCPWH